MPNPIQSRKTVPLRHRLGLDLQEEETERFEHYLNKSFNKTASLMAYSCKANALLSGTNKQDASLLEDIYVGCRPRQKLVVLKRTLIIFDICQLHD
jgi:hypothetical protein